MTEVIQLTIILVLYRVVALLVGAAALYMGYRLFLSGLFGKAGELKAAWGERALALKGGAPGTFFALFGVCIVAFCLYNPLKLEAGPSLDQSDSPIGKTVLPISEARTKPSGQPVANNPFADALDAKPAEAVMKPEGRTIAAQASAPKEDPALSAIVEAWSKLSPETREEMIRICQKAQKKPEGR